jgi:hypothetical protein
MYIQLANKQFEKYELWKCYRLRWVVFWPAVASPLELALELAVELPVCVGWVEVHLFLCISSISPDALQCHFGDESNRLYGVDEA